MMRKTLAALAVATSLGAGMAVVPAGPAAAITVFDPSNFAQNILQAARALEQINNQIQSAPPMPPSGSNSPNSMTPR